MPRIGGLNAYFRRRALKTRRLKRREGFRHRLGPIAHRRRLGEGEEPSAERNIDYLLRWSASLRDFTWRPPGRAGRAGRPGRAQNESPIKIETSSSFVQTTHLSSQITSATPPHSKIEIVIFPVIDIVMFVNKIWSFLNSVKLSKLTSIQRLKHFYCFQYKYFLVPIIIVWSLSLK